MNFFLIANNDSITDKTINDLPINEEDVIILYNRQMPLKWKKIKEHKNKYLFLRTKQGGFWGENTLSKNKSIYNKIFLAGTKIIKDEILENFKNKYKLESLYRYVENEDDIKKWINFPNKKSPQTGLISYLFVKNKYDYNKIYLIGFTNEYKSGLWSGHSKEIEQDFFKNEICDSIVVFRK